MLPEDFSLELELFAFEAEPPDDFPLLSLVIPAALALPTIAPETAPVTAPLAASIKTSAITSVAFATMPFELFDEELFLELDAFEEEVDFFAEADLPVDLDADLDAGLAVDVDFAADFAAVLAVFGADLAADLDAVLVFVAAVPDEAGFAADLPADADFDVFDESAFFPADAEPAAAGFLPVAAFAESFFDFVVVITFSLKDVLNQTYERIFTQKNSQCQGFFRFIKHLSANFTIYC